MVIKSPKQVITSLFKKHSEKIDNVIYAEKIFIINSVISYLFKDKNYTEIDKQKLLEYGELITKYLADEVDIYWKDGILMVKEMDGDQYRGG